MTVNHALLARADLADLLADAARRVSGILTAEYPTPAGRSYLHPVLGALAAGPRVAAGLNERLEDFLAGEPLPATPAALFTLASYASALGWLTESLAELTTSVDRICTRIGIPTQPPTRSSPRPPQRSGTASSTSASARWSWRRSVPRPRTPASHRTTTSRRSRRPCSQHPGSPTPAWKSPAVSWRTQRTSWARQATASGSMTALTACPLSSVPCSPAWEAPSESL